VHRLSRPPPPSPAPSPTRLADDPSFSSKFVGFDTGPGNVLMDLWVSRHFECAFDANGALAAKGCVVQHLLDGMLGRECASLSLSH
jgi:1,6-anhydro-N-acetylmuramate kinase